MSELKTLEDFFELKDHMEIDHCQILNVFIQLCGYQKLENKKKDSR